MNQEIYKKLCKRCKIETPHVVYEYSETKGVKLSCVRCGLKKPKYLFLNNLEASS